MKPKTIDRKAVIIPGAQKSGTTTLFQILGNHSAINIPEIKPGLSRKHCGQIKEPQFFALERQTILENFFWYKHLFSDKKKEIILDASTLYLSSNRAPQFIKEFIRDPKILIILRDPAKRAYSSFLHMHKKVPFYDRRTFDSIIREIEGPTRDKVISTENKSLERSIRSGRISKPYLNEEYLANWYGANFKSRFEDNLLAYKYFQESLYCYKVKNYENMFGDKVKVIFFENLILDFEATIKDILRFIGIEPEDRSLELTHNHKTEVPKNGLSRLFIRLTRENNFITKYLIKIINLINVDLYKPKPSLSREQYFQAREILQEEYDYWLFNYKELNNLWKY